MNRIDMFAEVADTARLSEAGQHFAKRHGVRSAFNLTVATDEVAALIAAHLEPKVRNKTVVDVGGGIGLLGLHLADIAAHVFVIEANPVWSLAYLDLFHKQKPSNMSFCFGAAEEFVGRITADIAIVATHSDVANMMSMAGRFAPDTIDIYGELIAGNPAAFDQWARDARGKA